MSRDQRQPSTAEANGPVKSADRVLALIEFLAADSTRQTLTQLALQLRIPKSSLHGLLGTMRPGVGSAPTKPAPGSGSVPRALRVGIAYLAGDSTIGLLSPVLDQLAERFGETVHLGLLDDGEIVYLAKRKSTHLLRLVSAVGQRVPIHTTAMGKVLLAERDEAALASLLPARLPARSPRTHTNLAALFADLHEIRERGYAIGEEENCAGVVCFAVAPRLACPPTDAISVSVPTSRLTAALRQQIPAALQECVRSLAPTRRPPPVPTS